MGGLPADLGLITCAVIWSAHAPLDGGTHSDVPQHRDTETGGTDVRGPDDGGVGNLAYLLWGSDPDLVMLHGFSDAALCWSPLVGVLNSTVLAIDARGHGHSGLDSGDISPVSQAEDVAMVLDALDLQRCTVVGHSMGASTAAALAGARPDLVGALVLEEPSPGGGDPSSRRPVPGWLMHMRSLSLDDAVAWCRAEYPYWPDDELVPWAQAKHQLNLAVFDQPKPASPTLASLIQEVRCPTLLIRGSGLASVLDDQVITDCKAVGSHIETVAIAAGHNVRRDARTAYTTTVQAWLRERNQAR